MMRKSIKYPLYGLSTIIILLTAIVLFTQTGLFRSIVKDKAIAFAHKTFNLHIELEDIEGNFYNSIKLVNLKAVLATDSSPLLDFSSLELKYDLIALLDNKIQVDTLWINDLNAHFERYDDKKWNLRKAFQIRKKKRKEISKPFSLIINADQIYINNLSATAKTKVKSISESISDLNIDASFYLDSTLLQTDLRHLSFNSSVPNINIKHISTTFKKQKKRLSLDSLSLHTSKSQIQGNALYTGIINSSTKLALNPIDIDEVKLFIPSIKLPNSPKINLDYKTLNDSSLIELDLAIRNEKISISALVHELENYTKKTSTTMPYEAMVKFRNVKPENWWEINTTDIIINGTAEIKGDHLFDFKKQLSVNANLSNTRYKSHLFNTLKIDANQFLDSITAKLNVSSKVGQVKGLVSIKDLYDDPYYAANLNLDSLILSEIIPKMEPVIINCNIDLQGHSFNTDSLMIGGLIKLYNSEAYNIPIDSAELYASLSNNTIQLNNSKFKLPGAKLNMEGNYDLDNNSTIASTDFSIDSLEFLSNYDLPDLSFKNTSGTMHVQGQLDSLVSSGVIYINNFQGFSITSETIQSDVSAILQKDQFKTNANLFATQIRSGSIRFDTLQSELSFSDRNLKTRIEASVDSISSELHSSLALNDTLTFQIFKFEINTPHGNYYVADTTNSIHLYEKELTIKDLNIKNRKLPEFEIKADGRISNTQSEDFNLSIRNFDLNALNRLKLIPEEWTGSFSMNLELSGQPAAPILNSSFNISSGYYGETPVPELNGKFNYGNKSIKSEVTIPNLKNQAKLSFTAPFTAMFDSLGFNYSVPETFKAIVDIDTLNIAEPLGRHYQNISASGKLSANLIAQGTFEKPSFYGSLKINNGKFKDEDYGVDVQDANISLAFDSNKVSIDTFMVKREKGYLAIKGDAVFDSSMITGKIISSSLEADAEEFFLTRHKNYEILIDAKTFIKSLEDKQEFGGKITVLRSDFYIPAIVKSDKEDVYKDVPILVEATRTALDSSLINTQATNGSTVAKKEKIDFTESLSGRLNLEIPRNTWLKSEEMKIEIWGDLEIVKSGTFFELFGEVGINRGHYILYGKKLNIEEGNISFQGGEEIDPILDFKAKYTYRSVDKTKRELELFVKDRLSEPTISFTLDGTAIPESDAVSILLFGKTMDELSYAGQNGIVGSVSTNMVAQMVSSQLNKTIGNRLNLDMIEINATENWQSAAFVVGKYITNDLFVIYQRGFGEADGDEITPETITLEYELNRILFFRLQSGSSKDSGVDVILKFESKKD